MSRRDDYIASVVEVYAGKKCEGTAQLASGQEAQYLNICGPSRTCKPCIARELLNEAQGLDIRR